MIYLPSQGVIVLNSHVYSIVNSDNSKAFPRSLSTGSPSDYITPTLLFCRPEADERHKSIDFFKGLHLVR